jgi:hypothetical protein
MQQASTSEYDGSKSSCSASSQAIQYLSNTDIIMMGRRQITENKREGDKKATGEKKRAS